MYDVLHTTYDNVYHTFQVTNDIDVFLHHQNVLNVTLLYLERATKNS